MTETSNKAQLHISLKMNPQTQNRLAALAVGAATLAYLGVKKPWKKTGPKTEDVPESKLPDGKMKKGIQEKEKSMSNSPVIQEQGRDQVNTATDEHQKRNWWYSNSKKE